MTMLHMREVSNPQVSENKKRKPRGKGFDREILIHGVKEAIPPEQVAKELHTPSVRSVRNAMNRIRSEDSSKTQAFTPKGESPPPLQSPDEEGEGHTSIWLNLPMFATSDTFEELKALAKESKWSPQLEWFDSPVGGELYIYGDTNLINFKKWLIRTGLFLDLCHEELINRDNLEEVSIGVIPANSSGRGDEKKWTESLFWVNYSALMEELRGYLKDFIINGVVRFSGSGKDARVQFDPDGMRCIGDYLSKGGFYFILGLDPLASVKYGYSRIVMIHEDEMVLVDNNEEKEISDLYWKINFYPNIRYLGNGKSERFDRDEEFRERVGYWTRPLPRESKEEAISLIRPFSSSFYFEYKAILGEFARVHDIVL